MRCCHCCNKGIAGLRTACMVQGPCAPIEHDRCFENWRSTDKTLVRPPAVASTCASSTVGRVAASKGTHLRIWGTPRLEAASAQHRHRVLCVLAARGGDETKSVRTTGREWVCSSTAHDTEVLRAAVYCCPAPRVWSGCFPRIGCPVPSVSSPADPK